LREVLRSQAEELSKLKKQLAATKTADPTTAKREARLQAQLEQLNQEREEEARYPQMMTCPSRFADIPE